MAGRVHARRGSGSVRKIRVVVANDPVSGRSAQRWFHMHGDTELVEADAASAGGDDPIEVDVERS